MSGIGVKKPVRSVSGVTPLTVVLKPRKCNHGTCIYCPGGEKAPQSYTNRSPAIMRALKLEYDPYRQVLSRLRVLKLMKHPVDKIEIIVLGGTFLQYSKEYKENFIKRVYDGLNEKDSKNLQEAKKLADTLRKRILDKEITYEKAAIEFSDEKETKYDGGKLRNPETFDPSTTVFLIISISSTISQFNNLET